MEVDNNASFLLEPSRRNNIEKEHDASGNHDCSYLVNALSIVVMGASGDLAKKKVYLIPHQVFLVETAVYFNSICSTRYKIVVRRSAVVPAFLSLLGTVQLISLCSTINSTEERSKEKSRISNRVTICIPHLCTTPYTLIQYIFLTAFVKRNCLL